MVRYAGDDNLWATDATLDVVASTGTVITESVLPRSVLSKDGKHKLPFRAVCCGDDEREAARAVLRAIGAAIWAIAIFTSSGCSI